MASRIHTVRFYIFLSFFVLSQISRSQNFTWMKGFNTQWGPANYGSLGVGAPSNEPGFRNNPAAWRDSLGNLWVFGGFTYYSTINDLWKYTISNNTWTWIDWNSTIFNPVYGTLGVSSPQNNPGPRCGSATWTDQSGNFWLFGGTKYQGYLPLYNDLWKYNPSTGEWTWMGGTNAINQAGIYGTQGIQAPANVPGARNLCAHWTDANGDFWLFGGVGFDNTTNGPGYLNDLWKYSVSTQQWTWMKGANTTGQVGSYGTQGLPSLSNTPGSRSSAAYWSDPSGNFWMMGGSVATSPAITNNYVNDLWKYTVSTNEWTWVNGSNLPGQSGNYGTLNTQSVTNMPGARYGSFGWYDVPTGNMYLFGGDGFSTGTSSVGLLNDFWKYSPANNQWTWVRGSNTHSQHSNFGTQGVAAPSNMPASRSGISGWIDNADNFWLFGGVATWTNMVSGSSGPLSVTVTGGPADVWKFDNCAPLLSVSSSSASICPGNTVTLSVTGAASYSWSTSQTNTSIVVSPLIPTIYTVTGTGTLGCIRNSTIMQQVAPLPNLSISSTNTLLCSGQSATLSVTGGSTYTWSATQNTNSIVVTPTSTSTYSVAASSSLGCTTTSNYVQSVAPVPSLTLAATNTLLCSGETVTLSVNGAASYVWQTASSDTTQSLIDTLYQTTGYIVVGTSSAGCVNSASITLSVNSCVGIKSIANSSSEFFIFPNPSTGHFTLHSQAAQTKNHHLLLINNLGEIVHEQRIENKETRFDLSVPKGFYSFLVLNQNGERCGGGKIMIQ